jgi:hypothetical protein
MLASEVVMGIKSLPQKKRKEVYDVLLADKRFREDLLDILTIENRRKEKSIPLVSVFKKLGIKA